MVKAERTEKKQNFSAKSRRGGNSVINYTASIGDICFQFQCDLKPLEEILDICDLYNI
jgi:hypothetical protein